MLQSEVVKLTPDSSAIVVKPMAHYTFRNLFIVLALLISMNPAFGQTRLEIGPVEQTTSHVVFIPGLLGSKLIKDGEIIFGDKHFTEEFLLYDGEPVETEILEDFTIFGSRFLGKEVYKDFIAFFMKILQSNLVSRHFPTIGAHQTLSLRAI